MANIQDTSSGKTSPEHFPLTAEKISAVSSKPSVRSKTAAFQFLDLRENGQKPERFWQNPIPSHGEFLMHNTGECPSEENGSFLSQILTEQVPEKYYLSPKVTPHSVGRCHEVTEGRHGSCVRVFCGEPPCVAKSCRKCCGQLWNGRLVLV